MVQLCSSGIFNKLVANFFDSQLILALNFDSVQNSSRKIKSFVINFIDSGLGFTTLEDGLSFNGRALPNITENFTFYWIQWDKTNNVCIKLYFFQYT